MYILYYYVTIAKRWLGLGFTVLGRLAISKAEGKFPCRIRLQTTRKVRGATVRGPCVRRDVSIYGKTPRHMQSS